jgi:hypothetical protein
MDGTTTPQVSTFGDTLKMVSGRLTLDTDTNLQRQWICRLKYLSPPHRTISQIPYTRELNRVHVAAMTQQNQPNQSNYLKDSSKLSALQNFDKTT